MSDSNDDPVNLDAFDFVEVVGGRSDPLIRPEVGVSVGRWGAGPRRCVIRLRGAASRWATSQPHPRFRVAVGGDEANVIRIWSDPLGRIALNPMKFRKRADGLPSAEAPLVGRLGRVDIWPDEDRPLTAARRWLVHAESLLIFLPEDFARSQAPAAPPRVVSPPAASSARPSAESIPAPHSSPVAARPLVISDAARSLAATVRGDFGRGVNKNLGRGK